ncbi:MAG: thiamine pyrophosphate-binding protein [Burkholderiales bacterium]
MTNNEPMRESALLKSTAARDSRNLLAQRLKAREVDGHTLIARSLQRLGVSHVYGISGAPIYETHAACAQSGMRVIGVRHQQAATMMAAAQNYIAGRLTAVAILSAGPAITNTATGILIARDNGWPLVALGARRPEGMLGGFQDLDAVPIFQSITKFIGTVKTASKICPALEHAVEIAISGRPGPVYLDLAEEILNQKGIAPQRSEALSAEAGEPNADTIGRAASLLAQAKRPAILIGEAIRWSEPYAELEELVDHLDAPFAASPMGRGYVPDDHPRCYNNARSFLLSTADAVLLIGAKLDWTFRFGAEIAPDAKLVQVAIHEDEIDTNVMPKVAIAGDVKKVLQRLLKEIDCAQSKRESETADLSWRALLDQKRDESAAKWETLAQQGGPISPLRLIAEIRDFIPRDAICVVDGNVILAAAQHLLPSYFPASRLTPGNNGCMGVGIPFGIAAKLSSPARMVIVICGDFAFGLSAMEMETAVRLRIPVIVVVANNDGNGGALNEKMYYPKDYVDRVTMFAPDIHYDQMMRTFGGYGEYVDHAEQIKPALARAVASGAAACINVRVNPDSPYPR